MYVNIIIISPDIRAGTTCARHATEIVRESEFEIGTVETPCGKYYNIFTYTNYIFIYKKYYNIFSF